MQEAIAEAALNETPFVVFNMARNQQDYFQCTRGGGWGDYRTITLAPQDVAEAVEHTQLAFHLADKHRAPVILYGDPLIAQTRVGVGHREASTSAYCPRRTGRWTAQRRHRPLQAGLDLGDGQANDPGPGPDKHWQAIADEVRRHRAAVEAAPRAGPLPTDARRSWWRSAPPASSSSYVVDELRAEGHRVGWFRPVTLWPFPGPALPRPPPRPRSGSSSSSSTPAR